jgi:hypothetical protein
MTTVGTVTVLVLVTVIKLVTRCVDNVVAVTTANDVDRSVGPCNVTVVTGTGTTIVVRRVS